MYDSTVSIWAFETTGPMRVALSMGSPTFRLFTRSVSFAMNSSWIDVLQEQAGAGRAHLALVVEDPGHARRAPRPRGRRRRTRCSATSRPARATAASACPTASRMICLPTSVEPVNAILSTRGIAHEGHADLAARAGHDVEDALGKPGLLAELGEPQRGERRLRGRLDAPRCCPRPARGRSSTRRAGRGSSRARWPPTTPTGWRRVNVKALSRSWRVSPWIFVAQPA